MPVFHEMILTALRSEDVPAVVSVDELSRRTSLSKDQVESAVSYLLADNLLQQHWADPNKPGTTVSRQLPKIGPLYGLTLRGLKHE